MEEHKEVMDNGRGTHQTNGATGSGNSEGTGASKSRRSPSNKSTSHGNTTGNIESNSTNIDGSNNGNASTNNNTTGNNGNANGSTGTGGNRSRRTTSGADSEGCSTGEQKEKLLETPSNLKPKDIKPNKKSGKQKEASKKNDSITDADTLSVLLQTGFALIAGITGRRHWNLTEDEAYIIANPASALLSKLTTAQKKKIDQLSAPVLLGSALASVIIPKALIDISMTKGMRTYAGNQSKVNSVPSRSVEADYGKSEVVQPTGNTATNAVNAPTNDKSVTQLFSSVSTGNSAGDIKL